MQDLVFVTGNKMKAKEATAILPFPIILHDLDLDEIQSLDTERIVRHKASQAYDLLHTPLFVDDISLGVDVWNGFPGPLIKFLLQDGNDLLLRLLLNEDDRSTTITATIGYHDGKSVHIFKGTITGRLAKEARGENGSGFNSLFIPDGYDKTFAEMTMGEKNTLSHRRRALEVFKEYLISHS